MLTTDVRFKGMHQNRLRLGLRPRFRWGSLQHSPDPLAEFRGLLLKEGEGERGKRRGEITGGEVRKKGKRGKVEGRGPHLAFNHG